MLRGEKRLIAVEDAGAVSGCAGSAAAAGSYRQHFRLRFRMRCLILVRRYGRTHGPFTTADAAKRFGLALESVEAVLNRLVGTGRNC